MKVERTEKLGRGRYLIYTDEKPPFVLYSAELRKFNITEQSDLTDEDYRIIIDEILIKRARLRAMNLLMDHSYTEYKLREKLIQGYYPEAVADNAIAYVKSYGYVDDYAFALDYFQSHCEDKSIERIKQDLYSKGISRDVCSRAFEEASDSLFSIDEVSQIRQLLAKKHFEPSHASEKDVQKMFAFLMRRGYRSETIRQVIHSTEE